MPAQAENRILLGAVHHLPRQLASSEIVGPDDRRERRGGLDELEVDPQMILLGGQVGIGLHVEELAAVEPDPARAETAEGAQLLRQVDVRHQLDRDAVRGDRRRLARLGDASPGRDLRGAQLLVLGQDLRGRMQDDQAGAAVHDHRVGVRHVVGDFLETGHRGQPERPGDDRRMRGPAAGLDGEADDLVAAQPDRFRRHEVVGDQDDVAVDVRDLVVGDPLQHPQELSTDVLEILSALAEVGVLDLRESLGELARRLVHGPLGVHLLLDDAALDLIEEHAVREQQRVGVEDGRQLLAEEMARLGSRALDLLLRGAAGRLEPARPRPRSLPRRSGCGTPRARGSR